MDTLRMGKFIVEEECRVSGVEVVELLIAPRTRTWAALRSRIIVRLKEETTLSYREIGTMVGLKAGVQKQYQRATA